MYFFSGLYLLTLHSFVYSYYILNSFSKFRIEIEKKCLAPRWNETFTFKVADPKTASLIIEVFDYDTFGKVRPFLNFSFLLLYTLNEY